MPVPRQPALKLPSVSFEFFPPSDTAAEQALSRAIERLAPLRPSFVSVTYGADGSTRDRTHAAVTRIVETTSLPAVPHLTCIGSRRDDIEVIARRYWNLGIRHIVALRGDPPSGSGPYQPAAGGYAYAADLVGGLRQLADFEISVAGYPETHPEAICPESDIANLRVKCDAGASRIITQFFFDVDVFLRFRDRCVAAGITVPVVPGILPVSRFSQLQRFAARCGASVPAWVSHRFEGLDGDLETRQMIAASVAIDLVTQLAREGVEHFHFYTLNRAELTYAVCHALGLRPARADAPISDPSRRRLAPCQ